jgi:signal transduction histidine kinase
VVQRDSDVEELLLERQAKGLRVPAAARILFAVFGAISGLSSVIPPRIFVLIIGLTIFTVGANVYFIYLLNRRRRVELVGWLGVAFDVTSVLLYPWILGAALADLGLHWSLIFKQGYTLVCLTMVMINALALQPRYPAVIGAAALVSHVVLALVARADPTVVWSSDLAPQIGGSAVGAETIGSQVVFLVLITLGALGVTRAARNTVVEAAQRQAERARLTREHAASVMEGRLDALRNLVASLSHEMNSPLGAIKSAAKTMSSAAVRLARRAADGDEKVARLVKVINDTAPIPEEASARLEAMLSRMTAFVQLDAGEVESVEVNEALERTVALIPADLRGEAVVRSDLAARARVRVTPARLNLALMTIVTNAFEANGGKGQIVLRTTEDEAAVTIEIEDDGPGLSEERAARLFEVRIDESAASRVKAGLGLPAAYSLIKKHGGEIAVHPGEGGGARFVVSLPRTDAV